MRILGVDTATSTASVAIVEDGRLIAEKISPDVGSANRSTASHSRSNHAEVILPLIESVLRAGAVSLSELSGLAVSIGPGSFTGLRVGLSTVKGLAYGWSIPVVGVSTLLANAARLTDFEGLICSVLDARKKEVYAALFLRRGNSFARLTEDSVLDATEVIGLVRNFDDGVPCLFIGDGATAYKRLLVESFGNNVVILPGNTIPSVASAVARLGEERCRSPNLDVSVPLAPVYLRLSEAEVRRQI